MTIVPGGAMFKLEDPKEADRELEGRVGGKEKEEVLEEEEKEGAPAMTGATEFATPVAAAAMGEEESVVPLSFGPAAARSAALKAPLACRC